MRILLGGLLASFVLWAFPAWGQISDSQVVALVEALRLVTSNSSGRDDGLESAWNIKPANIRRWSRLCLGEELTPEQFNLDRMKAQNILVCVMEDVLRTEYPLSGNDEEIAVRRAAAWWVSGDANLYDRGEFRHYTQQVLELYQNLRAQPSDFLPNRTAKTVK
ncbi:hypothetical protein [Oscillatoria acuminata]|uniref:Uncharacterized protein n=1 Tax=Oscillatoria acuminata PCC 6304 TaxID=56110 RepID=K9TJB3_9CYAN|nr:hypothetical protein [Oscillatoria acuminata]AFY82932.1 hypothetical protein Oscil6304_3362 [Oscillatoria acuminata PCC 6304]